MSLVFQKATKAQSRLRLALDGPAGSGKTYSLLSIAAGLAPKGRLAVIDTEHGSASKYADEFEFDVLHLSDFDPRRYIEAIQAAEAAGYDVIGIDSLSHAWSGKGGALEMVDAAARRSKSNNTYTAWRDVTPLHNALVEAILQSRCHVIATMRSKVEHILDTDPRTGKQVPRKVGMAPIQREGMDYEFDVVGDIDLDHKLMVSKTRCRALDGKVFDRPGKQFGEILAGWLSDGTAAKPSTSSAIAPPVVAGLVEPDMLDRLLKLRADLGMTDQQWLGALARRGVSEAHHLSSSDAEQLFYGLSQHLREKRSRESQFPLEVLTQAEMEAKDEAAKSAEDFVLPDAVRPDREARSKPESQVESDQATSVSDDTEAANTDMTTNTKTETLTTIEA